MDARLYEAVATESFWCDSFHPFKARIDSISDSTAAIPVASLDEVILSVRSPHSPTTNDGYRYSQDAYRLLCRLVCRGLYAQTTDLAGHWKTPEQFMPEFSGAEAVACFNAAVRTRFNLRIRNRLSFVKDARARLIVGMVAEEAAFVPMGDLANTADDIFTGIEIDDQPLTFHSAYLRGVRLTLRYATAAPVVILQLPDGPLEFRVGCDLTSELGFGESLRLGTVVLPQTGGCAVRRYAKATLKKTGRNFPKRLQAAFRHVSRAVCDVGLVEKDLKALAERLRLVSDDRDVKFEVLRDLEARLLARGMRSEIAEQTMTTFLGARSVIELDATGELAKLSDLDLFMALCDVSVQCDAARREFCEALASHVLRKGL